MSWRFHPACPVSALAPGSRMRVMVAGFPVCLANLGGTLYAVADACPHEGASLGEGGRVEGDWVVCGAHGWSFHLRSGACADDPGTELPRFPVGRKDGMAWVGFWVEDDDKDREQG